VLFITGTGTDVGKTYISASLLRGVTARGLKADALKPVMSGFDPDNLAVCDAGVLLTALGREATKRNVEIVAPFRFVPALPPTIAAAREDRTIYFPDVVTACRRAIAARPDFLLIEGAGGLMSPIAEGAKVIDLIAELEIPALLVCGNYMGAASHSLTALAALDARDIAVSGIIVNESGIGPLTLAETMGLIAPFASDRKMLAVPRDTDRSDALAAFVLDN
jgi:dethiobiotin synthetase